MRMKIFAAVSAALVFGLSGCATSPTKGHAIPRLPASDQEALTETSAAEPRVTDETLEAFLVAASHVSQLTADTFDQENLKLARINYLFRLARTLRNVYIGNSDGFDRRAGEIGPEKTLDLTAALNSLNSASATLTAAKDGRTTELKSIFVHPSDMDIELAQDQLLRLIDRNIVELLKSQSDDSAYALKDVREIIREDLI